MSNYIRLKSLKINIITIIAMKQYAQLLSVSLNLLSILRSNKHN